SANPREGDFSSQSLLEMTGGGGDFVTRDCHSDRREESLARPSANPREGDFSSQSLLEMTEGNGEFCLDILSNKGQMTLE
ncbi:MAG TPA: hypothetical protein PK530_20025, partial [Anaerolineales bacterium]|nr:hypothetical protein [Anaerolineales bacterium]